MTAILGILKIIGKLLLGILAVILLLAVVILICPVYYEIKGEKYDKINAEARIKLLLGILNIGAGYDGSEVSLKIKLFGREIKLDGKKNEKADKADDEKTETVTPKPDDTEKKEAKEKTEAEKDGQNRVKVIKQEKPKTEKTAVEKVKKQEAEAVIKPAKWGDTTEEATDPQVRKIKLSELKTDSPKYKADVKRIKMPAEEPIRDSSSVINDKEDSAEKQEEKKKGGLNAEYFLKMPASDKKKLLSAAIRLLKSLLKGVKPNDFYLVGTLGMSDPAITGQIVGAAWALNGILDKRIEIDAVFDREVIEGEFSIKGHIVPAMMLFYILRFILTKQVRDIILLLIKGDKNGK